MSTRPERLFGSISTSERHARSILHRETYDKRIRWSSLEFAEDGALSAQIGSFDSATGQVYQWNAERAANALDLRGLQCHHRKMKSANFRITGPHPREISIALGRSSVVSVFVNRRSVTGVAFPARGLDGIVIAKSYTRGHEGREGNRGISDSVARQNPSLDPANNDILRLHVRDGCAFTKLLDWYCA